MYYISMEKGYIPAPIIDKAQAKLINPLSLAFVGDAVQTLYVRSRLTVENNTKSGVLHRLASGELNAGAQALEVKRVLPHLTSEEEEVYKRGRNCKTGRKAKNAAVTDYRKASGLEALYGYLYLTGEYERLSFLLEVASSEDDK